MTSLVSHQPETASNQPSRPSPFTAARVVAGVGIFAAVSLTASQDDDGIVLCPYRRCTGGYCPGCGMTRAAGALLRGAVGASWRHHPFLLLAIAQIAVIVAWSTFSGQRATGLVRRWQTPLLATNALVLLVIWVARMATGVIPTPFS